MNACLRWEENRTSAMLARWREGDGCSQLPGPVQTVLERLGALAGVGAFAVVEADWGARGHPAGIVWASGRGGDDVAQSTAKREALGEATSRRTREMNKHW